MEHTLQTALQPGLGHVVQQVPGAADVHAFALQAAGDVIEEVRQVLRHLGLLLVEGLLLGQQFRRHHQAIQGALGMGRAQLGAQVQHIAGQGGGIGRVEMGFVRQQDLDQRTHPAQVAEVALAVVRVGGVHVHRRAVRAGHAPGIEAADLHGFLELAETQRQERQGAGGAGGVAQAQLRHRLLHGLEPLVEALAAADVGGEDLLADFRDDQPAQPFVDRGEVVLLQQRRRVGLEHRVLEQQRYQVVEFLDALDALAVGELLQHRNAVAHLREAPLERRQLQGIDLVARQLIPLLEGVLGQLSRVGQQQFDLLVDCSCHAQSLLEFARSRGEGSVDHRRSEASVRSLVEDSFRIQMFEKII
ncbi:hypothetical protein D9M70_332910 [compost metagenome]